MIAYDVAQETPEGWHWLATFNAREYAEAAAWVFGEKGIGIAERETPGCAYCEEPLEPGGMCSWGRCPTRKGLGKYNEQA